MINGLFEEISEQEIMSVNGGCGGGSAKLKDYNSPVKNFIYDFVYEATKSSLPGDNEFTEAKAREMAEKASGIKK